MNFRYRLMQFMNGRYGIDSLFYVLFFIAAVLSVINCFVRLKILQLVVYAIVFYAFFRVLSQNIPARQKENRLTAAFLDKMVKRWNTARQRRADRTHLYKKCPRCHAVLRLPRRRGRHNTICPKCGHSFHVRVYKEP